MSHSAPVVRDRRGFTLIELLITMTMISVVGAAVVSVFNSQQKFVRAASDIGGMRSQIQTASIILPAELRNISSVGNDIVAMSDSAITIRTTIGTSVVCSVAGNALTLAPAGNLDSPLAAGGTTPIRLTSVLVTPEGGDAAFVWDEGASAHSADDLWGADAAGTPYSVVSAVVTNGACIAPYAPSGNLLPAMVLTVDGSTPVRSTIQVGAGVRIARSASYGLYQATDGRWYLGYRDAANPAYQYVAGPFLPYATTGETGLRFRYFDSAGAEITNYALRTSVARIEVASHARTETASALGGVGSGKQQEDSLLVGVSLRNRD